MASALVLVNGLPGSGKTTLADRLAHVMGVPVLSKDRFKEAFADATGDAVSAGQLGQLASETMWQLAAAVPGMVIVESWWFVPRDLGYVTSGLARSGAPKVLQLWCSVPRSLARLRYKERARHWIHLEGDSAFTATVGWDQDPDPLPIDPTITVDTAKPVDVMLLGKRLRGALMDSDHSTIPRAASHPH